MHRIEKILFYLFIFLIPFQIGKLLFAFSPLPEFFYHQIFIYLSDIFILALLVFWGKRILIHKQERQDFYHSLRSDIFLILFFVFTGASVFVAGNKDLSIFHFVKLLEFLLLYFYIKNNFKHFNKKLFSYVLSFSAALQTIIAILQFYFQESLGIRHLGESAISPISQNIAKINEGGFKLIRAYGTFPHPNVLAAFLSVALFMTYYLVLTNKAMPTGRQAGMGQNKAEIRQESVIYPLPYYFRIRQAINCSWIFEKNKIGTIKSLLGASLLFGLLVGLFLTFSRSVIISFTFTSATALTFLFIAKDKINIEVKKIYKLTLVLLIIIGTLVLVLNKELFSRFSDSDSIAQRVFFGDVSVTAIMHSPILGAGIGNFVYYFYNNFPSLPEWQYQPVHNLFLLATAETGLAGGLFFILFLGHTVHRFFKRGGRKLFEHITLFAIFNFLILANFDHYFWSLQQGQILFWLVLGILSSFDLLL